MKLEPNGNLRLARGRAGRALGKVYWVLGAMVVVTVAAMAVRGLVNSRAAGPLPGAETGAVRSIGALAELNGLGDEVNAVFVFLPAKGGAPDRPVCQAMEAAKRTIETKYGIKMGLFSLKPGTTDYGDIAEKMSVPGVVAIVRTGARGFVTGTITEAKLVDGFGAAAAASGCCPFGEPDAGDKGGK